VADLANWQGRGMTWSAEGVAPGHMLARFAVAAATAFLIAAPSQAGNCPKRGQCWHGWGNSFYLNGERFEGGNPRGPANALNNWEGGFHPVVFFRLLERQSG
jgi:hypothetical protein